MGDVLGAFNEFFYNLPAMQEAQEHDNALDALNPVLEKLRNETDIDALLALLEALPEAFNPAYATQGALDDILEVLGAVEERCAGLSDVIAVAEDAVNQIFEEARRDVEIAAQAIEEGPSQD